MARTLFPSQLVMEMRVLATANRQLAGLELSPRPQRWAPHAEWRAVPTYSYGVAVLHPGGLRAAGTVHEYECTLSVPGSDVPRLPGSFPPPRPQSLSSPSSASSPFSASLPEPSARELTCRRRRTATWPTRITSHRHEYLLVPISLLLLRRPPVTSRLTPHLDRRELPASSHNPCLGTSHSLVRPPRPPRPPRAPSLSARLRRSRIVGGRLASAASIRATLVVNLRHLAACYSPADISSRRFGTATDGGLTRQLALASRLRLQSTKYYCVLITNRANS